VNKKNTEVQEFRSSGVQEFRSSGVQEFRSSGGRCGSFGATLDELNVCQGGNKAIALITS
jgi:hypothetical protein